MIYRGKGSGRIPLPRSFFPNHPDIPTASGLQIQFYGMFHGCQSIANVSGAIARQLIREFGAVGLFSYNGLPFFGEDLESHSRIDENALIGIYYGLPEARKMPIEFHEHAVRIGGFVCETDRIHQDWVHVCNKLNLVFVPSEFCRRAFVESGVKAPVIVVPHGLEPEFKPYDRVVDPRRFIFFNAFDAGSFHQRKSAAELVRCFCRTFGRGDGVELILRTKTTVASSNSTRARRYPAQWGTTRSTRRIQAGGGLVEKQ